MERKEGYYWVKYSDEWVPAEWYVGGGKNDPQGWYIENCAYAEEEFDEIDENRILTPDEVRDERLKEPEPPSLLELVDEQERLKVKIQKNKDKQKDIHFKQLSKKFNGANIGDTIEFTYDGVVGRGVWSSVVYSYLSVPMWIMIRGFNSDGEPKRRETRYWHSDIHSIKIC